MKNTIGFTSPGRRSPAWLMMLGSPLILALSLRPAAAQPAASLRTACAGDVRSVCAGVMPGGGRIKQCMMDKREQLSKACKDALAAREPDQKK